MPASQVADDGANLMTGNDGIQSQCVAPPEGVQVGATEANVSDT